MTKTSDTKNEAKLTIKKCLAMGTLDCDSSAVLLIAVLLLRGICGFGIGLRKRGLVKK